MNLRNTPPELPERWRGGVMDCCRALGREGQPIDSKTFRTWVRRMHVASRYNAEQGREVWSGKDINKMWYRLT